MPRALAFLAALALAAPATAATYTGKPATPVSEAKFVGRDIIWNQVGASYRGSTNESRPLVLCQSLAKRAGQMQCGGATGVRGQPRRGKLTPRDRTAPLARSASLPSRAGQFALATCLALTPH